MRIYTAGHVQPSFPHQNTSILRLFLFLVLLYGPTLRHIGIGIALAEQRWIIGVF
jgi:hypothetical protein